MNTSNPNLANQNSSASKAPEITTLIVPSKGWVPVDFQELWSYRELLGFLAMRDIKIRYKQSVLGILWAVIQPLVNTLVFSVLFGLLMGRGNEPSESGVPYFISTYVAMMPWGMFAAAITTSGNSLVANANLIKKIYFPRMIAPAVPMVTALIDFAIQFFILIIIMIGYTIWTDYQITVSWRWIALPPLILLSLVTALGAGLWLSSLNALYRDIRFILPFLVQIGKFVSPVVYATPIAINAANLGENYQLVRIVYGLNPMVGVIEGFRWVLLDTQYFPGLELLITVPVVIGLLVSGMYYFQRMEQTFVDLV